ncbi:MAG: adenylate/guanylate cyclase domain-containing protein [Gaiellaceae bacterium]
MPACPSCGTENAETAKFCSECGAALAAPPIAQREERKVVTVVFADMVGSTERAEQLDPEDVRALLAPYHARLRHELERHGGTVEKFIGDAVVAVFGAPVAHEDDAERGVRAALAIQEAITEMNEADPTLALEVRIGVNTGEALVALDARPELGEGIVSGDVVNTGARVQSAAPPGGVLVGEHTFRATERAIEYEVHQPVTAKGKAEPLLVWRAVGRRASWGIDLSDARVPLVGRDDECDVLVGALTRARTRLEPQLVTVVGVPGIGKSRLVRELFRVVDEDPELIVWRQGRSLPYGEGSAFWGLAEIVKAQAGILETDGADEAAAKVAATVADLVSDPTEGPWVERHVLSLTGVHQTRSSAQADLDEAFAAWRRLLEALAERQPAVLVFEDLHWADDALLDFVDALPDRVTGVPLLVVCSARPELLERRPGWGGGKRNAATVSLAPLSDEDTARLLAALLGTPVLPADEQVALLQRAGGNPLFAEEYARMLADGSDPAVAAPETLQGVVAARIDALPPPEKELLQLASVLGKVFWTDALASLSGASPWELEEHLHALERKEFVRREYRSAVAGSKQYVFVHALVRDGTYGQMSRVVRADVHQRVAEWIETLPADRADDRSEILAHHLLEAIEYSRAAGLDATELVPRAAKALRESGGRAWRIGALSAALDFYSRLRTLDPSVEDDPYFLLAVGLALATGGFREEGTEELERAAAALESSDPAAAAQATITRGEFVWQGGDQEGAFVYFDRARALVDGVPLSREKQYVVAQNARFLALAGRYDEAGELAEQSVQMAEELGDDELLGDALNNRGLVRASLGDPRWLEDSERSVELALRTNSFRVTRAYINLGSHLVDTAGDLARGEAVTRDGLAIAQKMGLPSTPLRWFIGNLAEMAYLSGKWDEAFALAEQEIASDHHYLQHMAFAIRAAILLAKGDPAGASEDADTCLRAARAIRDPQALHPALVTAAEIAYRAGDPGAAHRLLDELGAPERAAGTWTVRAALLCHDLGRELTFVAPGGEGRRTVWREAALAVAGGELERAGDILEPTGAQTLEAAARLRAAEQATVEGRLADAKAQLGPALAFYREVRATAYVRAAEALLAEAS